MIFEKQNIRRTKVRGSSKDGEANRVKCKEVQEKNTKSKKHALDMTTKRSSMSDTRVVSVRVEWSGKSGFSKLKNELEVWKWT